MSSSSPDEIRYSQAINQGLGYRNFSDYVNRHRLGDAKRDRDEVDQQRRPQSE